MTIDTKMLEYLHQQDGHIRSLDPLNLNEFLTLDLPKVNTNWGKERLRRFASQMRWDPDYIANLDTEESKAAIRDLGIIAGSLVRFGCLIKEFSTIEDTLMQCSKISNEVPSDTIYTYVTRNPKGELRRTFTTHVEEGLFIESLGNGIENMLMAADYLGRSQEYTLDDPMIELFLKKSATCIFTIITDAHKIYKILPSDFFTKELRPFFDPRKIGGKDYFAPGGAQMPILFIDQILWGVSVCNLIYVKYVNENLIYQPPILRGAFERIKSKKTIKELLEDHGRSLPKGNLEGLKLLLQGLTKFRRSHLAIAEKNLEMRPEGSFGSGGYRTEILIYLLDQIQKMEGSMNEFK